MLDTKRFVTIAEYQRRTGLSYPTIKNALETGQLRGVRTVAGYWKVSTADSGSLDTAAIMERLGKTESLVKALCNHLGVTAAG